VPGNASGGMDGIALKPLTVSFSEPGFVATLNQENQLGPWFTLSNTEKQQLGNPMGPRNPQALNRYSYVLNNPVRNVDPSGHEVPPPINCPWCNVSWGNIGSWNAPAKGVAVVRCVIAGCHINYQTGEVTGPSTAEYAQSSVTSMFGTVFSGEFQTAKGAFSYIVEGSASGTKFITSEIAIYPSAGGTIEAGQGELLKLARQLIEQTRNAGFKELEINAVRHYDDGTKRVVQLNYTLK